MKYILSLFIVAALCFTVGIGTASAAGNTSGDGRYSFQLENDGYSLPTWYWNGYTYVEGRHGQSYNIRVFNHTGKRVEAVVTVDGRDAITGQLGDYKKNRGYVIKPYSSVLIKGFRTSWRNVAGFYFTDIENSYSARMGSGQHVGVIGVAVFEEKTRRKPRRPVYVPRSPRKRGLGTSYGQPRPPAAPSFDDDALGGAAKSRSAEASESRREAPASRQRDGYRTPAPSQSIGTGYGSQEYSPASSTEFQRKSRRPGARLSIYYDDRQSLIDRGIIPRPKPRPRPRPQQPNPFPRNADPGFAPPPPSYYWE